MFLDWCQVLGKAIVGCWQKGGSRLRLCRGRQRVWGHSHGESDEN